VHLEHQAEVLEAPCAGVFGIDLGGALVIDVAKRDEVFVAAPGMGGFGLFADADEGKVQLAARRLPCVADCKNGAALGARRRTVTTYESLGGCRPGIGSRIATSVAGG